MQPSRLQRLIGELKRRHVLRVAAAYAVAGWLVIQVAETIFPVLELPDWTVKFVVALVLLGFPIAIALSWALDVTDRGIERTPPAEASASTEHAQATPQPPPAGAPHRLLRPSLVFPALALVLATGFFAYRQVGQREPEAHSLAVLPFVVAGTQQFQYLGEGMVDLLSRSLNGAADFRTLDAGLVLSAVGKEGGVRGTEGRGVAQRLGASYFLTGSIYQTAGKLRIQAALHDAAAAEQAPVDVVVEGDTTALFALVDSLAARLLVGRRQGPAHRLAQTAAVTTGSLSALKAYLAGEQHLRAARYDSAIAKLQEAVAEDSTFALAWYRLGVTAGWANRPPLAREASRRALAYADRLSARDRRLFEANDAYARGRADEAEALYRAVLRDYPDDLEAEFQLADVLYHFNPLRGRQFAEARPLFDRVLAVDPEFVCPI